MYLHAHIMQMRTHRDSLAVSFQLISHLFFMFLFLLKLLSLFFFFNADWLTRQSHKKEEKMENVKKAHCFGLPQLAAAQKRIIHTSGKYNVELEEVGTYQV